MFQKGMSCAGRTETQLVIDGEDPIASAAPRNPNSPSQHTLGALLRDPSDKAPTVRIRPCWDPIEAAEATLEILMSQGLPGANYELTVVTLAPSGLLFMKVEDPESRQLHLDLLQQRERTAKPLSAPYRESGPSLTSETGVLYEARHVIFPLAVITMMDLQATFVTFDPANRTIHFELRRYKDMLSPKPAGQTSKASLQLTQADWDRVTETRGFFKKETQLRSSDFWNLLTREVLRNLIREKLQKLFLNASETVETSLKR